MVTWSNTSTPKKGRYPYRKDKVTLSCQKVWRIWGSGESQIVQHWICFKLLKKHSSWNLQPNLVGETIDEDGNLIQWREINTQVCEQLNAWLAGYGINLIRNPLSARNPGVSHCQFETPPLSTVRCCLVMFLETHVGDCSSTCRAPAACPAVNKCSASLLTLFLRYHRWALNAQSPSFHCVQWLSDLNYDTHCLGSLHWQPCVAAWRMQAIMGDGKVLEVGVMWWWRGVMEREGSDGMGGRYVEGREWCHCAIIVSHVH